MLLVDVTGMLRVDVTGMLRVDVRVDAYLICAAALEGHMDAIRIMSSYWGS
jgi:hypothetical protein